MRNNSHDLSCESCGSKRNLGKFFPPYEQIDDEFVYFCESCFMSDDVSPDEPMTTEEKLNELVEGKKRYLQTLEGVKN